MNVNQISVNEIEDDLSKFIKRIEAGENLEITKAGKPLAEIKPVSRTLSESRPFGLCEGDFAVPDDFDAPLPEEIIQEFEGK